MSIGNFECISSYVYYFACSFLTKQINKKLGNFIELLNSSWTEIKTK